MNKQNKLQELRNSLEECAKLKEEYLAGWQRAKADFENYKKEEEKRVENKIKQAEAELLREVLAVYDNLNRALKTKPKHFAENDWLEGVLQIESQLKSFLKSRDVKRIKSKGRFNPHLHEVLQVVEDNTKKPEEIVEVLEHGYKLNGRVLRPAKVKVNK